MRWAIRWGFTSPPDKLVTPEGADQLQPLLVGDTLLANKGYDADQGVIDHEFQRWYKPPDLSVESIQNRKSKILKPPHLSVGSI